MRGEALVRREHRSRLTEASSLLHLRDALHSEGAENTQIGLILHVRSVAALFALLCQHSQGHVPCRVSVL